MRPIYVLSLGLVFSVTVFADSGSGFQPSTKNFYVSWTGNGSWPEEAEDAAAYAETVSNYDGTLCFPGFPSPPYPPCDDPKIEAHNRLNTGVPHQFGLTTCTFAADGFCQVTIVLGIDYDVIEEDNLDAQFAWCHEIGHALGAGHTGGQSSGCMSQLNEITYHQHHIDEHIQWDP